MRVVVLNLVDPIYVTKKSVLISLLLVFLVGSLFRLIILIRSHDAAYGYDYGFYLFALKNTTSFHYSAFLSAFNGGYENLLFPGLRFLSGNLETNLHYLLFLVSLLLLPAAFYFYFHKKSKLIAISASLLAAVSIIQMEVYTMFLLKTAVALPLLILVFKFFEEKKYVLLSFTSLLVFATHRTTLIILILTFTLYMIAEAIKKRSTLNITVVLTILFLEGFAGQKLLHIIKPVFDQPNSALKTGLFLENLNIFQFLWPFIFLAVAGGFIGQKFKGKNIFQVLTLMSLSWILFKFPFYHRLFIYLDLGLIYYGANFLGNLNYKTRTSKVFLTIFLIFSYLNFSEYISEKKPLISRGEIEEIKNFQGHGTVLATSSDDAPWLLGYLPGEQMKLRAPGMFADPHTLDEWIDFWSGHNQETFLELYDHPIFIYDRSLSSLTINQVRFRKISSNFFLYNYKSQ